MTTSCGPKHYVVESYLQFKSMNAKPSSSPQWPSESSFFFSLKRGFTLKEVKSHLVFDFQGIQHRRNVLGKSGSSEFTMLNENLFVDFYSNEEEVSFGVFFGRYPVDCSEERSACYKTDSTKT